jgi:hypothetical protein
LGMWGREIDVKQTKSILPDAQLSGQLPNVGDVRRRARGATGSRNFDQRARSTTVRRSSFAMLRAERPGVCRSQRGCRTIPHAGRAPRESARARWFLGRPRATEPVRLSESRTSGGTWSAQVGPDSLSVYPQRGDANRPPSPSVRAVHRRRGMNLSTRVKNLLRRGRSVMGNGFPRRDQLT